MPTEQEIDEAVRRREALWAEMDAFCRKQQRDFIEWAASMGVFPCDCEDDS